jgi:hypothetical protein
LRVVAEAERLIDEAKRDPKSSLWDMLPLRSYFRGLMGRANTLRYEDFRHST